MFLPYSSPLYQSYTYLYSSLFPFSCFSSFIKLAKEAQIPVSDLLKRNYDSIKQKGKIKFKETILTFEKIEFQHYQMMAMNKLEKQGLRRFKSLILALSTILELLLRKSIGNFVFYKKNEFFLRFLLN